MSESFMSSETVSSTPAPEDTMKILVATDIHLGYGEKDPIIRKFLILRVMFMCEIQILKF